MGGYDFDVLIVGSGFGGSVAALRLTEKGYRVGVLEAGRRFTDADFPKTSWRLQRFLWAPKLGCTGIQRIHVLKDVVVLAGAGVGGGSLVYANTLYVPPKRFFEDKQWAHITDWADELAPYYDQASRMLGVVTNPTMTPSDLVMKAVADDMGVGHTFRMTPVGVYFGDGPGVTKDDPFFGGVGPARTGCTECGECMTGCRHNAKNTLPKNYLALAEQAGAVVFPLTTATTIEPREGGGYTVQTVRTGSWSKRGRSFTAEHVIMAAGTYNTQKLLHRMKDDGKLPRLSRMLGRLSRTNSESILGAIAKSADADYTRGVAITSSFFPDDEGTHVEPCRYGKGSNSMGLLQSVLTVPRPGEPRWRTWTKELWRQRTTAVQILNVRKWSERAVISLVMQPVDNSLTLQGKRGRFGWRLATNKDESNPAPSYIPISNEVAERMAEKVDGIAGGNVFDNFDAVLTAHFVGGCAIGADEESGVVDPYHRVYNYPGLHIVDGAAITANLGVNPSLTITAQAERAMALWPNKGEEDARPELGTAYVRISAIEPKNPVVPDHAPGALRLPIVEVR
ncbi:MAG: GMC family oxidoreductase [Actinomycetales bacterium]|nr:GMC family oxidoreductase [Actinomycetales bacterium]